jgi:hypothetical protein
MKNEPPFESSYEVIAHDHSQSEQRGRKHLHPSARFSQAQQPMAEQPRQPVFYGNAPNRPQAFQAVSLPHPNPQYSYTTLPVNSPPLHPVHHGNPGYEVVPQSPVQHDHLYGSPPLQSFRQHDRSSAIRNTSTHPRRPSREEGLLQHQWGKIDRMAAKSYADLRDGTSKLTANYIERPTAAVATRSMQALCQGAALCDNINTKFDAVMTSIDNGLFSGKEQDLMVFDDGQHRPPGSSPPRRDSKNQENNQAYDVLGGEKGSNHFSKVWLYSNSRLPPHLPPFKVYLPTYPLMCLAATYSERVYTPPTPKTRETEDHIRADWRSGTKAMVLKSIPVDDMNTVVFAIRGSQTFMDWAVNYNSAPTSPKGFLDDPSNLVHAGFLYVARKMVKPVAERLKVLLEENPARSNCSLLITGHSAGGAVAALLYAHMMSKTVESNLSYLTSFFKRVHCITFGAPPISILAIKKTNDERHRKSLFYAFVNEGDPVPRADKGIVRSLLKLYASPAPAASALGQTLASMSKLNLSSSTPSSPPKSRMRLALPNKLSSRTSTSSSVVSSPPAWAIPTCSLAPAGRIVILRQRVGSRNEDDAEAVTVDDELLYKVVYGDPLKHQMQLYKTRIDSIATKAVTGGGF